MSNIIEPLLSELELVILDINITSDNIIIIEESFFNTCMEYLQSIENYEGMAIMRDKKTKLLG